MLANRIKETTATTGTTNFVLAGAVAKFRAFIIKFAVNRRFVYWAVNDADEEWETGIGYQTESGGVYTLVRETVLDNSADGTTALSFTTAPTLFSEMNSSTLLPSLGVIASNTLISSEHLTGDLTDITITANRIYYMPFLYSTDKDFDSMVILFDTVDTASKVRLGLYENNSGRPGDLIIQTGDVTPNAETFVETSVTQTSVPVGWYFIAMITDGTMQTRKAEFYGTLSPLGIREGQTFAQHYGHGYTDISSGWSALPSTAGTLTLINAEGPKLLLRVV